MWVYITLLNLIMAEMINFMLCFLSQIKKYVLTFSNEIWMNMSYADLIFKNKELFKLKQYDLRWKNKTARRDKEVKY